MRSRTGIAFLFIFLGAAGLLGLPSCSTAPSTPVNNTPTATPTITLTPTPTGTYVYPGILFQGDYSRSFSGGTTYLSAELTLLAYDQAVTTAGVTLTYNGGALPVPYLGPVTFFTGTAVSIFSQYRVSGTNNLSGWVYTPGQACTLTAVTPAGTVYGSVTAGGGITVAPDGSQVSWGVEGNQDIVQVIYQPSSTLVYQSPGVDAVSPLSIPSTIYSSAGNYRFAPQVANQTNSITNGGAGSFLTSIDAFEAIVTKP